MALDKKTLLLLSLILILGAFLRLYQLSSESFWLDEGATAMALKENGSLGIMNNVLEKGQIMHRDYFKHNDELPLYYMILSQWSNLFGISELSLRSFSAIFGIGALLMIFFISKLFFKDSISLVSTFLASINLTLIGYSQEARQYSYLLFLSLLSLYFLMMAVRKRDTKYFAGLLITNFIIIYSHIPWVIFIMLEGIYATWTVYSDYSKKITINRKIVAAFLIMFVLYLPMAGRIFISETSNVGSYGKPDIKQIISFGVQMSTWIYPSDSTKAKINGRDFNLSLNELILLASAASVVAITAVFFIIGAYKLKKYKKGAVLFLLLFLFPLIFAFSVSMIHPRITVFQLKQIIYIIPAYIIISALGIASIKNKTIAVSIIAILSLAPIYSYYHNPIKQQFREAAEILPNGADVFITKQSSQEALMYYYGEKGNIIGVDDISVLKEKLKGKTSFWFIFTFTKYSDPNGSIKNFMDLSYTASEKTELFDLEIFHYNSK